MGDIYSKNMRETKCNQNSRSFVNKKKANGYKKEGKSQETRWQMEGNHNKSPTAELVYNLSPLGSPAKTIKGGWEWIFWSELLEYQDTHPH